VAARLSAPSGPWLLARRYAVNSPAPATTRERDAALARPDLRGRAQGGESGGLERVGRRELTGSFLGRWWDDPILTSRPMATKSNGCQTLLVHLHPLVRSVTRRRPARHAPGVAAGAWRRRRAHASRHVPRRGRGVGRRARRRRGSSPARPARPPTPPRGGAGDLSLCGKSNSIQHSAGQIRSLPGHLALTSDILMH
jgi:hypothetical protein